MMFLPRVKGVFARSKPKPTPDLESIVSEPAPAPNRRWSIWSLIALLFLIVVVSNLAVDTADWIKRSIAESGC